MAIINSIVNYINELDYSKTSIKELVLLKKTIASSYSLKVKDKHRLLSYIDSIIDTIRYKTLNLYN